MLGKQHAYSFSAADFRASDHRHYYIRDLENKLRSFCYLYFFLHIFYIWIMLTIARHAVSSKTYKEIAQRLRSVPVDSRSSLTTYYMKVT